VWLSIEKTTKVDVWYIANVVIGTLEIDGRSTTKFPKYWVLVKVISKYDSTILKLYEKSLN